MSDFQRLKLQVLELIGLSKDAVHVHLGLAVFLAVLLLARSRAWRWSGAWLAAAVLAVGIEVLDLRDDWATEGRPRWGASIHDIVNTLVWPTILAVLGRWLIGAPGAGDQRAAAEARQPRIG